MKRIKAGAVVLALLLGFSTFAADDMWLIGKWELSYDSDGNPKDWLEFAAEGRAYSITPQGRRIPGRYTLKDSQIEVKYSFEGKMIPVTIRFSANKDLLLVYSAKTKNTSQYRKAK